MKATIRLKPLTNIEVGMMVIDKNNKAIIVDFTLYTGVREFIGVKGLGINQMWAEVSNGSYPVGSERGPLVEREPSHYIILDKEEAQNILDDGLVDKEVDGWLNVKYNSFSMVLDGVKYDGKGEIKRA